MTQIKKVVGGILKLKNNVLIKKFIEMRRNEKSRYVVAEDVKKGHFAVIAEDEEEKKRFVVPLSCLTNPIFKKLLEQAAEKYGLNGDGVLTVPCRPNEFEMLLVQQRQEEGRYCYDHVMFKCY
ncbi:protein SMALL AUXIN UP-REGULATED RNA 12-like [Cicer arietinum]|uniref:Auxin-responsive protein SAUR50-like n=1 Tax=Cicer arietinum TaxID=3827 RepID=A0A1S2YKM5_CICAR|nr:auxin-responsive protein SAUR50-like [Cicer arietinum]